MRTIERHFIDDLFRCVRIVHSGDRHQRVDRQVEFGTCHHFEGLLLRDGVADHLQQVGFRLEDVVIVVGIDRGGEAGDQRMGHHDTIERA